MANTPAQVALDERALLKARNVVKSHDIATIDYALEVGIRAYLSSLSDKAGDDGQGALVEVADRHLVAAYNAGANEDDFDMLAAKAAISDALTRENAAHRADKERLERERDEARTRQRMSIDRDGHERLHLCRGGHEKGEKCEWETWVPIARAEAAERRLAEQGQAQGEAVAGLVVGDGGPYFKVQFKALADTQASPEPDTLHEFKNFHRNLCERFDYFHDEKDWQRDQVSLIEHIARKVSPEPDAELARKEAVDLAERAGIDMLDDHDEFITDLTETLVRFARHRKQGGE